MVDTTLGSWPGALERAGIPVDPSAPDARQWLKGELAKAPYQAAQPTWFDRASQAFFEWINSLTVPSGEGLGPWLPLIITVIVAAVVVTAFLIFGLPRLNRRSRPAAALFGEDDRRSADAMRRSALAAAATGAWSLACEEMFRAIARGLFERTIVQLSPGTTAHDVAAAAATAFPGRQVQLAGAAVTFDQVRYLGALGTEEGFGSLAELEVALRAERPVLPDHDTAPDDRSPVGLS
ncbi:hypothetical protein GCM10022381_37680 [Leifsonia kafniensis]|uniref:Protein-glutamine gamma-glutamyltransferase-like C-terminal domain-containing protein n=1 Tax=Leifsonia kafniensis TaxID=475957 RepID=A0ABP7L1V1_9MICO